MKKGFTLIEVMVVIVIMGILAAVAVPKLFGNVAKAKVSEISVAAGAYIKLQDVFLAEKTALGNWSAIGYVAPGNGKTNNFCYNQGTMTENTTAVEQQGESLIGWAASNVATLNDCRAGGWWSLVINVQGSNDAAYSHNVSSNECSALVTGWGLGTTMSGSCESTSVNQVAAATPQATPQPAPQETPKEEPKNEPETQPEQVQEEEKTDQPVEEDTPEQQRTKLMNLLKEASDARAAARTASGEATILETEAALAASIANNCLIINCAEKKERAQKLRDQATAKRTEANELKSTASEKTDLAKKAVTLAGETTISNLKNDLQNGTYVFGENTKDFFEFEL